MPGPRWSLHFAWGRPPYALDLPEIVIGRGDSCPLQIDEPAAAGEHARFIVDDDERVWLENVADGPTVLNGRPIAARTRVEEGDFVQIGTSVLTLRPNKGARLSSSPAAHTLMDPVLPEEVQRAIAERDEQRTIEADAAELLATIPGFAEAKAKAAAAQAKVIPSPRSSAAMTLIGIGPELGDARRSRTGDNTPLPAPLPAPAPSIPDLAPLLRRVSETLRSRTEQGEITFAEHGPGTGTASLGIDQTRLSARAQPTVDLAAHKTMPPVRSPIVDQLATAKTMAPTRVPTVVAEAIAADADPARTQPPVSDAARTQPPVSDAARTQPPVSARQTAITTPSQDAPYVAPARGAFGALSRALGFLSELRQLARRERALVRPIAINLAIALPVSLALSALLLVVRSPGGVYGVLALGVTLLYFIDYACNAMTASLVHDYVTTGRADVAAARGRVAASLQGILVFAAVSALLDVASTYARERHDVLSRLLLRVLRAIWTTATYVIMPAMVIERASFKDAFARSRRLMDHDPTGVGAGVAAVSLLSYLCAAVVFPVAYLAMRLGAHVHPALGALLFFTLVNVYWAASGWLKIAYATCFYLWAARCEREGRAEPSLAPLPLRHALDAG